MSVAPRYRTSRMAPTDKSMPEGDDDQCHPSHNVITPSGDDCRQVAFDKNTGEAIRSATTNNKLINGSKR